jgi:UDP-N-acetylmuramate dehydrogenase
MKQLAQLAPATRFDEPLAAHCTLRVGGPTRALVQPRDARELRAALTWLHRYSVPFKVVGKGANLLIGDRGFDGAVVLLGEGFNWLERKDSAVFSVGAGLSLSRLCWQLARMGVGGFEFAAQIPGTMGGALVNNAGAYGQDFTHRVIDATVLTAGGPEETLPRDQLRLAYRSSRFKGERGACVVGATIEGIVKSQAEIQQQMAQYARHRAASQPVNEFSAGCIFKNPPAGDSAGLLIDAAGLKGATVGRAIVSPKHANFIINRGRATAREVADLIARVRDAVHEKFSVRLETEVELVDVA